MPGSLLPVVGALAAAAWWCYLAKSPLPAWHTLLPAILLAVIVPFFRTQLGPRRGLYDMALLAFGVTAAAAAAVAFDQRVAIGKLGILVGGIAIGYAVSRLRSVPDLRRAAWLFVGSTAGLSLYFLVERDWVDPPAKFPVLAAMARSLAGVLPALPKGAPRFHPNIMGGMAAALLPFAIPIVRRDRPEGSALGLWSPLGLTLAGIATFGLVLSESRSAWLAIALAAVTGLALWHGRAGGRRSIAAIWAGTVVVAALTVTLAQSPRVEERLALASRSLSLASDYGFTGAGLATFPVHYAVYGLLEQVIILPHSHNLYVDLAFEQGFPGLLFFLLIAMSAFTGVRAVSRAAKPEALLVLAALTSQVVILVHGLMDDALYGTRGAWVLFLPAGVIASVSGVASREPATVPARPPRGWMGRSAWVTACSIGLVGLALGLGPFRGALFAHWYANRGALTQARIELRAYDPARFDAPTLDEVRQRHDFGVSMALYERALEHDPRNQTAHQRRLALLLSRAEYGRAERAAEEALAAGRPAPVTGMLIAEALLASGRVADALPLLSGFDGASRRLRTIVWYRYARHGDYGRAADGWAAIAALDPDDPQAAAQESQARRLAGSQP